MTTQIIVTSTPNKQGSIKVVQHDTLQAARVAVFSVSDRHLTKQELQDRAKKA